MEHRNMVDKVAAYGCSFTEGQELPDEQFIKNAEKKKLKLGWKKFSKQYKDIIHGEDYLKEAKNLAWPKYVADAYGVEYYNNAQGGSSLESVCYKVMLDLKRKIISSDSLILIGLPNSTRWIWPTKFAEENFLSNMLDMDRPESKAFAIVHSDAKLLNYYYSNLEYLELLSFKHNLNIKTYSVWERTPELILNLKENVSIQYYEYMESRWNSLKNCSIFNWNTSMSDFSMFPNSTLGGGHFCKKVHEDFATFVYNDIER